MDDRVAGAIANILKADFDLDYDHVTSAEVGGNKKERYVFMWRTDNVRKVRTMTIIFTVNIDVIFAAWRWGCLSRSTG